MDSLHIGGPEGAHPIHHNQKDEKTYNYEYRLDRDHDINSGLEFIFWRSRMDTYH